MLGIGSRLGSAPIALQTGKQSRPLVRHRYLGNAPRVWVLPKAASILSGARLTVGESSDRPHRRMRHLGQTDGPKPKGSSEENEELQIPGGGLHRSTENWMLLNFLRRVLHQCRRPQEEIQGIRGFKSRVSPQVTFSP